MANNSTPSERAFCLEIQRTTNINNGTTICMSKKLQHSNNTFYFMLFTIFSKGFLLLSLSLASCEVDRALGQRIHVINHVIIYYTFTSASWWIYFCTLWSRVRCVAYNYVAVHEHEWMICDELESLQAKPLSTRWRPRVILHGDVIRKSKKKSYALIGFQSLLYEVSVTYILFS